MASYEKLESGLYRGIYYVRGKKHCTRAPHFERALDAKNAAEDLASTARRETHRSRGTLSASTEYGDWWPLWWAKRTVEESTKRVELYVMKKHIVEHWQTYGLDEITHEEASDWRDHLLRTHSRNYACKIWYLFQGSMTYSVKSGVLNGSPCVGITITRTNRPSGRRIEDDEFEALRENLRRDYRDQVDLLADTGMRPGELGGLHTYSVPKVMDWLEIQDALASKMDYIRSSPKDDEARAVPITERAGEVLERLKHSARKTSCGLKHTDGIRCRGDLLIRRINGEPMSLDNLRDAIERACTRLRLALITPYDLRRYYASRLAASGVDAFEIARLMGHSTLEQAMEYVRRTAAARSKVLGALGDPRVGQLVVVQGDLGQPGTQPGTQPHSQRLTGA